MASFLFSDCKLAGHNDNSEGIPDEETRYREIFLCGPPRQPWREFCRDATRFE